MGTHMPGEGDLAIYVTPTFANTDGAIWFEDEVEAWSGFEDEVAASWSGFEDEVAAIERWQRRLTPSRSGRCA